MISRISLYTKHKTIFCLYTLLYENVMEHCSIDTAYLNNAYNKKKRLGDNFSFCTSVNCFKFLIYP